MAVLVAIPLVIGLVVLFSFLLAFLTQFVWNSLSPALFNGPTITLWQAFLVNCALGLIGNFLERGR